MSKKVLNVECTDVFELLADNQHIYCFDYEHEAISDLYYLEINYIHDILFNAQLYFLRLLRCNNAKRKKY